MSNRIQNKKTGWINVGKITAMAAVLVDHTNGYLYTDGRWSAASWFSVTLFVLLGGGGTIYIAFQRHKDLLKYTGKRIKKFLGAYAFAMVIYVFVVYRYFDAAVYLNCLVNFNLYGVFYYVCFYAQLIIVSPLLYGIVRHIEQCASVSVRGILYAAYIAGLLLVSGISLNYTCIRDIYGGGKYAFGGTYLLVYGIGMCGVKWFIKTKDTCKRRAWLAAVSSTICWVIVWLFIMKNQFGIDRFLLNGTGPNPPGISLIVFAFITMLSVKSWYELLELFAVKWIGKALHVLEFLGDHTMSIFLYHILIRDYIAAPCFTVDNMILRRIIYMILMIGIPVCLDYLYKRAMQFGMFLLQN